MPITATFASCRLIFSSRVAITVSSPNNCDAYVLIRKLAVQYLARSVRQQARHGGVAEPLADPGDSGGDGARVGGGVNVAGGGAREPVFDQPARRLGLFGAVRPVQRR